MLQCFDIEYLILGDLDCFKDEVPKFVKHLKIETIEDGIAKIKSAVSNLSVDYESIDDRITGVNKNHDAQSLQHFFEKFVNGEIKNDDTDLISLIQFMQSRYTKGNKEAAIIEGVGQEEYDLIHLTLRNNNIFIWSKGDLETYYTEKAKDIKGSKDIKALELSYLLQQEEQNINELFLHMNEISLLVNLILSEKNQL